MLEGPVSSASLDQRFDGRWIASRRFGLRQGEKTRLIDNGRESELNSALTTHEKLELQDVDDLVCVVDCSMKCVSSSGDVRLVLQSGDVLSGKVHPKWGPPKDIRWLGRTLDLKAAYKQVATDFNDRRSSNIVVYNPHLKRPEFFVSNSLMFGSTAAVYAFQSNKQSTMAWDVCLP